MPNLDPAVSANILLTGTMIAGGVLIASLSGWRTFTAMIDDLSVQLGEAFRTG